MDVFKSILKIILDSVFSIISSKSEKKANWYSKNGPVVSSVVPVPVIKDIKPPPFRLPVKVALITSEWGWRKLPGMKRRFHHGIDYSGRMNMLAYAICPATVTQVKPKDSLHPYKWKWLNDRWFKNNIPEGRCWTPWIELTALHDENLKFYYMHGEPLVNLNDKIEDIDLPIYKIGNFGNSQGTHLHFGVKRKGKWIDPLPFLNNHVEQKEAVS